MKAKIKAVQLLLTMSRGNTRGGRYTTYLLTYLHTYSLTYLLTYSFSYLSYCCFVVAMFS